MLFVRLHRLHYMGEEVFRPRIVDHDGNIIAITDFHWPQQKRAMMEGESVLRNGRLLDDSILPPWWRRVSLP